MFAVENSRLAPVLFLPGNGGNHQQVNRETQYGVRKRCCTVKADGLTCTRRSRCGRWRLRRHGRRGGGPRSGPCSGMLRTSGRSAQPSMAPCWSAGSLHKGAVRRLQHNCQHAACRRTAMAPSALLLCPVQEQQTAFAVDCLRWLLVQHAAHDSSARRIIVVGHSMGGVVARAAVAHLAAGHDDGVLCIA
jgi:pimeloyl-ACP methyl ester carboxylesterase